MFMTAQQLAMVEKQRHIQEEYHDMRQPCLAQQDVMKKKQIRLASFSERLGLGCINIGEQLLWYAE